MTTKIKDMCNFPDGSYAGKWGGYTVEVLVGVCTHKLLTVDGVRGMNIPCTVTVKGGSGIVEVSR